MMRNPESTGQDHGWQVTVAPAVLAAFAALAGPAPAAAQASEAPSKERRSVAPRAMQAVAPALAGYTDDVLFGDVWRRPQLSPRDRSVVTLSVLIATGKAAQLTGHTGRALDNGVEPTEIAGIVTHLAFYTGWPNAVSSLEVIEKVIVDRKINMTKLGQSMSGRPPAEGSAPDRNDAADAEIRSVAPKLAELTDNVLLGDLWRRTDLTPRDRSLVTIALLAALGDDDLAEQIRRGVRNGLTHAQIGEAFTHLAFYAGWPRATAAVSVARTVFAEAAHDTGPSDALTLYPPGASPRKGPAGNFTGTATVTSPFKATGTAAGGATVTFRAGARTNWHSHPKGQLLIVTEGAGWIQAEGGPVRRMETGDVVWTGPGIKHWHGATRTTAVTHVAVSESVGGQTVTWLGPVADREFSGPSDDKDRASSMEEKQ